MPVVESVIVARQEEGRSSIGVVRQTRSSVDNVESRDFDFDRVLRMIEASGVGPAGFSLSLDYICCCSLLVALPPQNFTVARQ